MSSDDDQVRPVTVAAAALVTIPIILGVLLGVGLTMLAGGFALVSGITVSAGGPAAQPTLYMPKYSPTATPSPPPTPSPTPSQSPTAKKTSKKAARTSKIELFASPLQVKPGEQINLNGIYLNVDGVTLQVQQKTNGTWGDFPVTVQVQKGNFSTYVITRRTGPQQFRVKDPSTGRVSNAVTVTVG